MSMHRGRRRRSIAMLERIIGGLSRLCAHPIRLACFVGIGLVLFVFVLTRSLPYALAPSAPELALALDPNNPAALIAKAEILRTQLLKKDGAFEQAGSQESGLSSGGTIAHLPEAEAGSVRESVRCGRFAK